MTVTCSITKQLGTGRLLKSSLDLALKIKDRTGVAIPYRYMNYLFEQSTDTGLYLILF